MLERPLYIAFALVLSGLLAWAVLLFLGPPQTQALPRDRALPRAVPDDGSPLKIAVLGTSLSESYDWPRVIETALQTCLERPVEIAVFAKSGAAVDWGQTQVSNVLEFDPTLILIEFSANDSDIRDGLWKWDSRARTIDLVNHLHAPGTGQAPARIALVTMNPAKGLRGIARPFLSGHYEDYRTIAAEMDLGLLDVEGRWRQLPRSDRKMRDGIHPQAKMARDIMRAALLGYLSGGTCIEEFG